MVSVKNITKEYDTKNQKNTALRHVSLDVENGEALAILGLNGAGKSTLVKAITGILMPTEGEVVINNLKPSDGKAYRRQYSVVYQNNGLDFYLSVYENLKINGYIYGLRGEELHQTIEVILDMMDLQIYRKSKVSELSGGYAKRVQVAKALMLDTPVILLDEPTQGMDPFIKKRLFDMINKRKQAGKTIIYTTQILEEVDKICSHVAILKNGHMMSKDTIQNTRQKFSMNNVMQIVLSHTEKNVGFTVGTLERIMKEYGIKGVSYELHHPHLKISTKKDVDSLFDFCNKLKVYIDVEELMIKKASLEEILLNMEGTGN